MGIIAAKVRLRGHDKGHNHPPPPSCVPRALPACEEVSGAAARPANFHHAQQPGDPRQSSKLRRGRVWNLLGGEMLMEHPCLSVEGATAPKLLFLNSPRLEIWRQHTALKIFCPSLS